MSKRVISFLYKLTNSAGELLDSSDEGQPIVFLEESGQIIPGLETELLKLQKGDKKTVNVAAANAYGEKDNSLILKVPKEQFKNKSIKVGDMFRSGPDQHSPVVVVAEVLDNHIVVDGNHPLAGQDLIFDVEVTDIRPATDDEISHGHAHGPGGHHHH